MSSGSVVMKTHRRLFPNLPEVRRLGLATRGNTHLPAEAILHAYERGIRYWNWCGYEDGMSRAVGELGTDRGKVILATQIQSSGRDSLLSEVESFLDLLKTDRIDIATIYYLETREEWTRLREPGGVLETLYELQVEGTIGKIGITSHRRRLAAEIAERGETDLLMIRYNAAHRGAETEVFPIASENANPGRGLHLSSVGSFDRISRFREFGSSGSNRRRVLSLCPIEPRGFGGADGAQ
ncbi:MAG: aldo/keto reductase [Candidatus Omnitrophica bacterium]|nr:aldo/keto reductase [Candidatus Omnitrophota bacterium]